MPTNSPEIKLLVADWYQLAQDNPLFVIALVVIIWLLVAVIYNFKILFLKKNQKAENKLHLEVQSKLTAAEKQLRQHEEQLAADSEQRQKDTQIVTEIQAKVLGRNQAIVGNIRAIAKQFDLSEQLVGSDKEMQDEFIWQQQDNIIQQLTERLGVAQQEKQALQVAHQQEMAELSEKDSSITQLQSSLDSQAKQFTQLERAIEEQKHTQLQQQKEIQQQLSDALDQQKINFTQKIDSVATQVQSPVEDQQETSIPEQSAQLNEPVPETITEQKIVEFSEIEHTATVNEDVIDALSEAIAPGSDAENIIQQNTKQQPVESEAAPSNLLDNDVQDLLDLTEPVFSAHAEIESKQSEADTDVANYAKSSLNVAGKFKNLLGKVKKSSAKIKSEKKPATVEVADLNVADVIEIPTEQQVDTFSSDDLSVPKVEEVHIEPDYGASNFKVPGAFKKLFGKVKK
ncbi:MAG: hypothetical protein DRQ62_06220 [Gammaproteobacteria bacterium]|nr:MAG: hypothetical protein DRQ62_06220 [Gammaproteobacteria bacterium]